MIKQIHKPIGIFDSGMGGLSVLKELKKIMPSESFIYYADNLNSPYGNHDNKKIISLSENAVNFLLSKDLKALIVACNTVTAVAINQIRNMTNLTVIGMEPAVLPAIKQTKTKNILLLATKATLRCKNYPNIIDGVTMSLCPCYGLANYIEKNYFCDDKIYEYILYLLKPFRDIMYDYLVLGCTHYVLKKELFCKATGNKAVVIDGNLGTISNLYRILNKNIMLNDGNSKPYIDIVLSDTSTEKCCLYKDIIQS